MRILLLIILAVILALPAQATQRFALVIGIDDYVALADLRKARNDATAVAQSLEYLGIDVSLLLDPERRRISRAISDMIARTGPGDEVLFYFAGHGIQIDGRNFLIPADAPAAKPGDEAFLMAESIPVDQVMETLKSRGAATAVLILDACRDNPFPRNGTRAVGSGRGLAPVVAVEGSFILYSAGAGQTALDRLSDADTDPNSVFTRNLLPYLEEPDRPLQEIVRDLRTKVEAQAAAIGHRQRPAYYDELTGDYLLAAARTPPAAVQPAIDDPCTSAARDWEGVAAMNDPDLLRAFAVAHFPCEKLRTAALERVVSLERGGALNVPEIPPEVLKPSAPAEVEALLQPDVALPPDKALIEAAQTELKRLGCYRGPIDGDWGRGSRAALAQFYKEVKQPDLGAEPTEEILSLLKRPDNASCPPPPRVVAKPSSTARAATQPATTKPAAPPPAQAPAPKKKCGKLILLPFPAPIELC